MPRGILGSLAVALVFVGVTLVLVGMFHYSKYAGNAEPRLGTSSSGHGIIAAVIQAISGNRYVHRFNWYDVSRIVYYIHLVVMVYYHLGYQN